MSARYASVVFLDGEEGRELVDMLTRTDGVVVHGATEETIATTATYLAQWDYADELDWWPAEPWGSSDHTATVGRYVLAWNVGLGYVSLTRVAHVPTVKLRRPELAA
jgi:hypothetical protein